MKKLFLFLVSALISLGGVSVATTDYWEDIEAMLGSAVSYPLLEKYCSYDAASLKYQDCTSLWGRLEDKIIPKVLSLVKKIEKTIPSFSARKTTIKNLLTKLDAIKVGKTETQRFLIELIHQEFSISLRNATNYCISEFEYIPDYGGNKAGCCQGLTYVIDPDDSRTVCVDVTDGVCGKYEDTTNSKDCQSVDPCAGGKCQQDQCGDAGDKSGDRYDGRCEELVHDKLEITQDGKVELFDDGVRFTVVVENTSQETIKKGTNVSISCNMHTKKDAWHIGGLGMGLEVKKNMDPGDEEQTTTFWKKDISELFTTVLFATKGKDQQASQGNIRCSINRPRPRTLQSQHEEIGKWLYQIGVPQRFINNTSYTHDGKYDIALGSPEVHDTFEVNKITKVIVPAINKGYYPIWFNGYSSSLKNYKMEDKGDVVSFSNIDCRSWIERGGNCDMVLYFLPKKAGEYTFSLKMDDAIDMYPSNNAIQDLTIRVKDTGIKTVACVAGEKTPVGKPAYIVDEGGMYYDYCSDGSTLQDYICSNGYTKKTERKCQYGCEDGLCKTEEKPQKTCTDDDGNDIYTASKVEDGQGRKYFDACYGNQVIEYLCSADSITSENTNCLYGCDDGACKKKPVEMVCSDTDGGINYYEKGKLLADGKLYKDSIDYCQDETYLMEYDCGYDNGVKGSAHNSFGGSRYKCSYGCSNGACKEEPVLDDAVIVHREDNYQIGDESYGLQEGQNRPAALFVAKITNNGDTNIAFEDNLVFDVKRFKNADLRYLDGIVAYMGTDMSYQNNPQVTYTAQVSNIGSSPKIILSMKQGVKIPAGKTYYLYIMGYIRNGFISQGNYEAQLGIDWNTTATYIRNTTTNREVLEDVYETYSTLRIVKPEIHTLSLQQGSTFLDLGSSETFLGKIGIKNVTNTSFKMRNLTFNMNASFPSFSDLTFTTDAGAIVRNLGTYVLQVGSTEFIGVVSYTRNRGFTLTFPIDTKIAAGNMVEAKLLIKNVTTDANYDGGSIQFFLTAVEAYDTQTNEKRTNLGSRMNTDQIAVRGVIIDYGGLPD